MATGAARIAQRTRRATTVRVFFACWLVYTVFWAPYIVREHFPALAIAERGSLNVERYLGWTDDIFRGPRGGAFINNNPGASLAGAIPLLLFRPLLSRVDEWNRTLKPTGYVGDADEVFWRAVREDRAGFFLFAAFVTMAFLMAPATAGVVALLCSRLIEAGVTARSAAGAALLTGLGTPLLFRVGYLNHNLLVADAGFASLLLLWDPGDRQVTPTRAAGAGLLAGYTLLCDYSGIVVILTVGIYVWLRAAGKSGQWRVLAAFAGGLVPGCAGLLAYQTWAFGSAYLPSQQFMPATAPTSQGYRGFSWPSPALAWALLVDPRFGLFAYCPALVLALAAPFARRGRFRVPRREMWLLLGYFALFMLFCSANQYSWLQPLTGFRYLVPVVPGLALLAIQTAQSLPRPVRMILTGVTCLESFLMAASAQNDVRLALETLWQRRFQMLWMTRLRWTGMPAGWLKGAEFLALAAVAIAAVQVANALRITRARSSTMTIHLE